MRRYISTLGCLVLIAAAGGCRTAVPWRYSNTAQQPIQSKSPATINAGSTASTSAVGESRLDDCEMTTVGFESVTSFEHDENSKVQPSALSDAELSLEQLIAEVQTIHPTVEAMYAAWQAAAQRYPQAVSLEDPMFGATLAPASIGSHDTETAYMVEASQKLPWHGKRALRGAVERASADSASQDVETTRQKLAEIAELAYWDYYVSLRLLKLNDENQEILESFRDNAISRYENALVTQQDVFQADIELANLEQRRIEIERMERTAVGRINVLLRRNPLSLLPQPPESIVGTINLPEEQFVLSTAVSQRPEISAVAARVREEQSRLALACKQYYPDAEVFGRYDAFWDVQDLRGQVGARVNLPVYTGRLNAAVHEAQFQVAKARSEYDQTVLDVQSDVQLAYQHVIESQRTVDVYSKKLIPAAGENVKVAQSSYDTSAITFLDLALAQRQLIDAREKLIEAEVEAQRRFATLRRMSGGKLPDHPVIDGDPALQDEPTQFSQPELKGDSQSLTLIDSN